MRTRARRTSACSDGASSSAIDTRSVRPIGFATAHDTSPSTPSESTPGTVRSTSTADGAGASAASTSATHSRTTSTTTSRIQPLPGSASRIGASTAATTASRHVGTGTLIAPSLIAGVGTVARIASSTPSAVAPSSSSSGRSWMRWRSAGRATAFTSSGVTNGRPDSHAHAFAACSTMAAPRGDTPSVSDGDSRVARARATMYASTARLDAHCRDLCARRGQVGRAGDRAHSRGGGRRGDRGRRRGEQAPPAPARRSGSRRRA